MYKVDMFYTIKTLLSQGKSLRGIARQLGISRDVVTRIRDHLAGGSQTPPEYHREKVLDEHALLIRELWDKGLSAELIHQRLVEQYQIAVSYPTVARFVSGYKSTEVYVPVTSLPGQEAQVDFGYLGCFEKEGAWVKVWVFSMVLSHSRYSYHRLVVDQQVSTFITCHLAAFEFFGGVPKTVKIDNLKAGVIATSFYEPLIQQQYSEFLAHYGAAPVTARVRRPQDKGKVEAGIKYVKNNFLKGIEHRDYAQLQRDLGHWNQQICNQRLHGTTQWVPRQVFVDVEQKALLALPALRYQVSVYLERKVNTYGHIAYGRNFYSVPYQYTGQLLTLKVSDATLSVFQQHQQVALPALSGAKGEFITQESHKPPYKQSKSKEHYQQKAQEVGPEVVAFLLALQEQQPFHWRDMITGICALTRSYEKPLINQACQPALAYQAYSYPAVKNICHKGLSDLPSSLDLLETSLPVGLGGFAPNLSHYDQLTNPSYP